MIVIKLGSLKMNTEIRELNDADLDRVSGGGGMDGYHFCWDGPAGTGTYPNYVECVSFVGSVAATVIESAKKAAAKPQ